MENIDNLFPHLYKILLKDILPVLYKCSCFDHFKIVEILYRVGNLSNKIMFSNK